MVLLELEQERLGLLQGAVAEEEIGMVVIKQVQLGRMELLLLDTGQVLRVTVLVVLLQLMEMILSTPFPPVGHLL